MFFAILLIFSGCVRTGSEQTISETAGTSGQTEPSQLTVGGLTISYLDVGQGDSIFIQLPNDESILIDAGDKGDGSEIIRYIKDCGKDTLDYVIATHPHADHIGSMAEVIGAFKVKNLYMPRVLHTSRTYENLLDAIAEKGLKIQTAKAGKVMIDSEAIKAEFLAPNSENYSDLNDYSAVLLLTYNDTRFLFMGDAEKRSEAEILASGVNVSADVLKVGHHGSDSSSSKPFIKAVRPKYAIISAGKGNRYGHPDLVILDRLKEEQSGIWRTDEKGTVVVTSDGKNITIKQIATSPISQKDNPAVTVYITRMGTKYHRDGCRYLNSSRFPVALNQLDTNKYAPCSVCKPPAQ